METSSDNEKSAQMKAEIDSLSEELLRAYQEINILYRMSDMIGIKTDLGEIAHALLDEVLEMVPARMASVMLLHPIFDKAGNVVEMIEYFLDITERKRMVGMTAGRHEKKGRTVHITLKYSDFQVVTRQATIPATCTTKETGRR
ncbi:MAG: hypothetical protein ABIJ25_10185 [Pseudomonadota bacterium]